MSYNKLKILKIFDTKYLFEKYIFASWFQLNYLENL